MSHYHLYAIGNALVDSEYQVADAQLAHMGVAKGQMTLIDSDRRAALLHGVSNHTARRNGGGSAGNTAVALSQLGGKAFYSCRVSNDELGHFYTEDLVRNGVATNLTHTRAQHGQTGSCLVFVTPDAERSMCTFLGATAELDDSALHPKDIAKSRLYYMEGYLAASPTGLAAALAGKHMARDAGCALAATLSDVSMIQFCRPGLESIMDGGLDYLFCNEQEAAAWCGIEYGPEVEATLAGLARTVCITRAAQGCVVLQAGSRLEVPAPATRAMDTNGAGDMFAGAFMYAVTHGYTPLQAARLGNLCASRLVATPGARLPTGVVCAIKDQLVKELGLV